MHVVEFQLYSIFKNSMDTPVAQEYLFGHENSSSVVDTKGLYDEHVWLSVWKQPDQVTRGNHQKCQLQKITLNTFACNFLVWLVYTKSPKILQVCVYFALLNCVI